MPAPAVSLRDITRRFGGVLERGFVTEDMFGDARVKAWLEDWPQGPAHEAVDDLVRRVTAFGDGRPLEDDVTVVYVHRPA